MSAAPCTEPAHWPAPIPAGRWLLIGLASQQLWLCESQSTLACWPVSVAANGLGEAEGSGKTPRGWHWVRAKIGAGLPLGAVLKGRRPTGEVWSPDLHSAHPQRDWILTRILWLCGNELGKNRGGGVDSQRRYIYIHGTPDTEPMQVALSHGCVRMRNADVLALFDRVPAYAPVYLDESL